jgi:hypothetical protein
MKLSIKYEGLEELKRSLTELEKEQFPYAMARTLTKIAQNTQVSEYLSMQREFDRPTPYVLNSLYIRPCSKTAIEKGAEVGFKDYMGGGTNKRGANIVEPHASGGDRNTKAFENALRKMGILDNDLYVTPSASCKLDAYGNIPAGLIVQIMSYFKAFPDSGFRSNITDKRKAKLKAGRQTKKRVTLGYEYFVSHGSGFGSGGQHLPPGIYYKRTGVGKTGNLTRIFQFVKKPQYRKRFPFTETAKEIFNRDFKPIINEMMNEALKTAK